MATHRSRRLSSRLLLSLLVLFALVGCFAVVSGEQRRDGVQSGVLLAASVPSEEHALTPQSQALKDAQEVQDLALDNPSEIPNSAEADEMEMTDSRFRRVGFAKFFKKVGRGIKKVAKKIGRGIKKGIKKVGGFVKKVVKKVVHHGKKFVKKVVHHGKKFFKKVVHHGKKFFKKVVHHGKKIFKKVAHHGGRIIKKVVHHVKKAVKHVGNVVKKVVHHVKKFVRPKTALEVLGPYKPPPTTPLKDAPPEMTGRKLDGNFDGLDMPDMCPGKCNGRGKCLIVKEELIWRGMVRAHPYKCHCDPKYTGAACQTKVDTYVKWLQFHGNTPFPKCCNTCSTSFKIPTNFDDLPVYLNPFSVSNCDPTISIDSRPEFGGRPPCWRPLSAEPLAPEEESAQQKLADQGVNVPQAEQRTNPRQQQQTSLLELHDDIAEIAAFMEIHDRIAREQLMRQLDEEFPESKGMGAELLQTSEMSQRRWQLLKKIGSAIKNGAKKLAHHATNIVKKAVTVLSDAKENYKKFAAEKERIAKLKEEDLKRRAAMREQEMKKRFQQEISECCVYCNFDFWAEVKSRPDKDDRNPRGVEFQRALERQRVLERMGGEGVRRELLRREQEREAQMEQLRVLREMAKNSESSQMQASSFLETESQEIGDREAQKCCSICPVPSENPRMVDISKMNGLPIEVVNNRFGDYLKTRFHKQVSPCCNHCPSQFWVRHNLDFTPFAGAPPKNMVVDKVVPQPGTE